MPPLTDPAAIRALLETDRPWTVYALGDLVPSRFRDCTWYHAPGEALVLLYRAFDTPVLLTLGAPSVVQGLLAEVAGERQMYLHVRPEIMPLLRCGHVIRNEKTMWRMVLDAARFPSAPVPTVARLGRGDVAALRGLYADGVPAGEAPDFFADSMLDEGVFYAVREGTELVAAAGTHLVAEADGVAAVGNIYTRRDRRGRGLGARVTAAVTAELLRQGLRTIALNVHEHNAAAIRVYERLGFVRYCTFNEGLAIRR
jgi:ribosomal protein S18 acetylase RimI-like enzyme